MKKNIIISIIIFSCLSGYLSRLCAQNTKFGDNLYIELGAGAQMLFSKNNSQLSFGHRLTPSISLTAGKWFTPIWGARLQVQGYSFNAMSNQTGTFTAGINNYDPASSFVMIHPDGSYRRDLRYINPHLDLELSLVNLLGGYSTTRKWDIIPTVGVGYMAVFKYKGVPQTNSVSGNFSLMGKYIVTPNWALNIEVQSSIYPNKFDGRKTVTRIDNNLAVTLSATYTFSPRAFKSKLKSKAVNCVQEVQMIEAVVPIEKTLVEAAPIQTVVEKIFVESNTPKEPFVLCSILFPLNDAKISKDQMVQLKNVADYLSHHKSATVNLEGYADKATGSSDKNMNLSIKRAMAVAELLIDEFGVDRSRILLQPLGDSIQPYDNSEWNRVVLIRAN